MKLLHTDSQAKGWSVGPFNSDLPLSIGYANQGIDEPHAHCQITEIYLIARGTSTIAIEGQSHVLMPGDVLVVNPGEQHTFLFSSPDYFHFVVHSPGLTGEDAKQDKILLE